MSELHPLDILQGYRLGSRQTTVELQRTDIPGIHIDFDVFKLVEDIQQQTGQAIILTGTAGDGKTYLAYRLMDVLGLDQTTVRQAQSQGGYHRDGIYIDLDLSAGQLDDARLTRLYQVLSRPERLTLICVNEGKLDELQSRLAERGQRLPDSMLRINLSHRALVSPTGWQKVLAGLLDNAMWASLAGENDLAARNRAWLADAAVAERLRRYLLLPYLLGEPITVRETLSFLAYALGSGLAAAEAQALTADRSAGILPYLLFNAIFSEPDEYAHGGRAVPSEKLLWWLFRFDPAIQASPEVDLRLLVDLNNLEVSPPPELLTIWQEDLIVRPNETSDTEYRRRLARFMGYARRWYALASAEGFKAYFPFRHFHSYLEALDADPTALAERIPNLIQGLNLLLSGGQENDPYGLKIFYLPAEEIGNIGAIYSAQEIEVDEFTLLTDLANRSGQVAEAQGGDVYLERLPRCLYLGYEAQPDIRLPISLLLYEVLMSAAGEEGGFPATLWAKERSTVARFMSRLSHDHGLDNKIGFRVFLSEENSLNLSYRAKHKNLKIS